MILSIRVMQAIDIITHDSQSNNEIAVTIKAPSQSEAR